jgi:chromosome segregation ATPase
MRISRTENMSEYKTAVMELVLLVGKKSKRINELKEQVDDLEQSNEDLRHDLKVARDNIQLLKNDLKDLSIEFNRWRNGKTETQAKN